MSLKSLAQIIILIIIFIILGSVYLKYFSEINIDQNNKVKEDQIIDKNIDEVKEVLIQNKEVKNKEDNSSVKLVENKNEEKKQITNVNSKKDQKNVLKKIEYITSDQSGNRYKILASSGCACTIHLASKAILYLTLHQPDPLAVW